MTFAHRRIRSGQRSGKFSDAHSIGTWSDTAGLHLGEAEVLEQWCFLLHECAVPISAVRQFEVSGSKTKGIRLSDMGELFMLYIWRAPT